MVKIPLTKGYEAIVDDVDADLAELKWSAHTPQRRTVYAVRSSYKLGKKREIKLHRVILSRMLGRELLPGEQVDHRDGDGLNNTRENLRLATSAENQRNAKKRRDTSSRFKGVSWNERRGKWLAYTQVDGKPLHLGYYVSENHAARARDIAVLAAYGSYSRLNCELYPELPWSRDILREVVVMFNEELAKRKADLQQTPVGEQAGAVAA
jgi:hypothetical protein